MTIQLAAGVRLPLAKSLTTLSLMGSEPPWPSINSITPCQPSRPASVTTNDGKPRRVMIVPCSTPIAAHATSATRIAAHHGHPNESLHQLGRDDSADAADEPDRQVDLAEQEGEHLAHRQQHVDRALDQQVDEVARGEEVGVERLEQNRDEEQAGDDRQHAAVARADAHPHDPQVLAQRVRARERRPPPSRRPRRRRGRRPDPSVPRYPSCRSRSCLSGRGAGGHQVDHDLRVDLGSRAYVDQAAEPEHRDAVGDLEHVVHVV